MTRKRKKPESVSKWFKPVSKTSKNDSNELNENTISELPEAEADKNEDVENSPHTVEIGDGIEIMPAVIDKNNENQAEEIVSEPCDILDIKSKLVKEFKEKLAAHGLKLNSSLDLVSLELDPQIENEILSIAPDITADIPTNVHFHKFFLINTPSFLYL